MQCPKCSEPIMLVKADIIPIIDLAKRVRVYTLYTNYQCPKCSGKSCFKQDFLMADAMNGLPDEMLAVIKDANAAFIYFDQQHKDVHMAVFVAKEPDGESDTDITT